MSCGTRVAWLIYVEVERECLPGVACVVAKSRKGTWGCSCPAWIYQRGQHGDCKHIRHVLSQIDRNIHIAPYLKSILTPEKIQKIVNRFSLIEV
jgi:hypothetical protein